MRLSAYKKTMDMIKSYPDIIEIVGSENIWPRSILGYEILKIARRDNELMVGELAELSDYYNKILLLNSEKEVIDK